VTAPHGRTGLRRAIVIVPGAFTSGSLFFGLWSIIEATRGELERAAWFIVIAGVMDLLDGRVARMTRTDTAFGAELDSLVDVISFGVAPALLLYFYQFNRGEWAWLLCFAYVWATATRLARFNVEQAGHAKSHFFGLPAPSAGGTLATFVPFAGTPFFQEHLAGLPWPLLLAMLMVFLSLLMVSHVPYPTVPRIGIRTWSQRGALALFLFIVFAAINFPAYFFFPFAALFIAWGLLKAVLAGFLERLPERDPLRDEEDPEDLREEHGQGLRRTFPLPLRGRRRGGARREEP
jgi:CDP-diacylglycerol--serine O-phosphatidyltransferase